jgi:hypothetical protein
MVAHPQVYIPMLL